MKNRTNQILEIITQENKVEVSYLAEQLNVSKVTMRKDLDELENKGIIKREHGYALLRSADDLNSRIAYHYEAKKDIANTAKDLIHDGDTIMIENGSCCALLAEAIVQTKKECTIITNSAFIASYVRGNANVQIILLGGSYQQDSQVNVGPMIRQCVENFCVDLFFIGTDGYSSKTGFTNRDQMRAQAVRDMALQAEKVIVLSESEKFTKHGIVPLNLKNGIQMLITDHQLTKEQKNEFEQQNIEVITTKDIH